VSDTIPPEALLAGYPEEMRQIAERLRAIVTATMPDASEAVRPGWRLIGYDLPIGRRKTLFCFVIPEFEHVHLGFKRGVLMDDPDRLLQGKGITKEARWLTFKPGDVVDVPALDRLIREGARGAGLSRAERLTLALDREALEERGTRAD
jgi:hypothetical protein